MAGLEDLSDDILHLVVEHFRHERLSVLHQLCIVSKRLKFFADSVLCKTVILGEDSESEEQASFRFIERLLDSGDDARRHVRDLRVRSFAGDCSSSCVNVEGLIASLQSIQKLNSFSWDTKMPMPEDMSSVLSQYHPQARLFMFSIGSDQEVLSSEQLYGLRVSIPFSDDASLSTATSFNQLTQLLMQHNTIKALSLNVHLDDERPRKITTQDLSNDNSQDLRTIMSAPEGSHSVKPDPKILGVHLPLYSTDRLPALEELDILVGMYSLNREHCECLRQCMDWKKLKSLRIRPSKSLEFFRSFAGHLPRLQYLDFTYCYSPDYTQPCSDFITSLEMLKHLVIRSVVLDSKDRFWQKLVYAHGGQLQHLTICSIVEGYNAPIGQIRLCNFLGYFHRLTTLELDLHPGEGCCVACCDPTGTDYIDSVPFVETLQTVRLRLKIATFWTCYDHKNLSNCQSHRNISIHAHHALMRLWRTYFDISRFSNFTGNLGVASVQYWRWENPSPHAEQQGTPTTAYIKRFTFDSMEQGRHIVIRCRDGAKVAKTYYERAASANAPKTWHWTDFVPVEPDGPEQPFVLPDPCLRDGGNFFRSGDKWRTT